MWEEIIKSFITLFIIVDPFVSAAFFVAYAKNVTKEQESKAVWTATLVAGALMFIFLFTGLFILNLLSISFNSFKIGGGIILLIMGVTSVLGIEFARKKEGMKSAAILIGTPLLAGPGALTTIIILSKEYGLLIPAIAAIMVLVSSFILLKLSHNLHKWLGTEIIEISSRVLGLLLAALAIDFIHAGIVGFLGG